MNLRINQPDNAESQGGQPRHQHEGQPVPPRQRGIATLEMLIAALLVVTMLSIAAPLVVRTTRVWKQTRHHQLAGDELSSQMDRLIAMTGDERQSAMENLAVSEPIRQVLHDVTLVGQQEQDNDGKRIRLMINWERLGDPPPIELVAWVDPLPVTTPTEATAEDSDDNTAGEEVR